MSILEELYKQQSEIKEKIEAIQKECSHPKSCLKVEHKGDTGNYDPHADRYWDEYTCGLCDSYWTVDTTKRY